MTVNEMKELRNRAQIEGEIYCSQWAEHLEDVRIGEIEDFCVASAKGPET